MDALIVAFVGLAVAFGMLGFGSGYEAMRRLGKAEDRIGWLEDQNLARFSELASSRVAQYRNANLSDLNNPFSQNLSSLNAQNRFNGG